MTVLFCHAGLLIIAAVLPAWAGKDDAHPEPGYAIVHLDGTEYMLRLYGQCAVGQDGAYNIWAITPDEAEPDTAKPDAPRLHAASNGTTARLTFYVNDSDPPIEVLLEEDNHADFTDGTLSFEGTPDQWSEGIMKVQLQC